MAPDILPRLEIRDISRSFHGQRVVDQVSLRINPGQVTCLLGPSGCGKSTTLRIIAGVDRQDQGQILIDGQVVCDGVSSLPAEQRSIGLMFQDFALFPHLSVGDNVGFGVIGGRDVKRAAAETLLEKVGLRHRIDQYPHALSGGEQQRVAIARAMAKSPALIVADEPTGNLDKNNSKSVRDLFKEIANNATIIIATHDNDYLEIADKAYELNEGKLIKIK